jgi:hypothetical protein
LIDNAPVVSLIIGVFALFHGSALDVYVHWLIMGLGIGVLVSAVAVLFSCRSFAGMLHLLSPGTSWRDRCYRGFFRYHAYYWAAFGLVLVLHLMVTVVHVGTPVSGEVVHLAHVVVYTTAITNVAMVLVVLTSCRTVNWIVSAVTGRSRLGTTLYRGFYRFHGVYWWLLVFSVGGHIVSGIIHAINT